VTLEPLDGGHAPLNRWTSAHQGYAQRKKIVLILAAGAMTMTGTAGASELPDADVVVFPLDGTAASIGMGAPELGHGDSGLQVNPRALAEIRRRSGLTWEQLAEVFGVSRRSVHLWASGKPLSSSNEERLHAVLSVVRSIDRGNASETRAALCALIDGTPALRLLAAGRYDEVARHVGRGTPEHATARSGGVGVEPELVPSPDVLASASTERIHRDVGRGRAVATVRLGRRGDE
jgi:transcriptional regulator with XRE-family HTH domain